MDQLFINIGSLVQVREPSVHRVTGPDMAGLPTLENAWLSVTDGRIDGYGLMANKPSPRAATSVVDCTGRLVLPTWCDSHTHLVYAGDRSGEWLDRLRGMTYAEVAERGGGIVNSAHLLQKTDEDDLYEQSRTRLERLIGKGTGAIEIKSGYGLTLAAEMKMLRVIRRLREAYPLPVRATFLGAHALPPAFRGDRAGYVQEVVEEMIPRIAGEGLADYVDVFCEAGYFDVKDTERILETGTKYGLPGKIHVNQFTTLGGVAAGVRYGARSVDHLEELAEGDVEALRGSRTMPVALPGCSHFLGIPYTPARRLLEAGLPLALASDYNPGSCPSGNMNLVVSLACTQMQLLPAEAINAATLNGAYAMGLEKEVGSITVGKSANLIITEPVDTYVSLPYRFGEDLIWRVYLKGEWIREPK